MSTNSNQRWRFFIILCAGIMCSAVAWGAPVDPASEGNNTMFDLIMKGGKIMIPLGIGSILALALSIERCISLRRDKVIPPEFSKKLVEVWHADTSGKKAIAFCEEVGGAVGKIFKAGLQRLNKGEDAVEKAIEDAGYREADKMKRSVRGLSIVARVAPLLGLLGTVLGMIEAFQASAITKEDKSQVLSVGIYEALVTTATGLIIAIPTLLVYQFLTGKIDGIVDELDEMGMDFMLACSSELESKEDSA